MTVYQHIVALPALPQDKRIAASFVFDIRLKLRVFFGAQWRYHSLKFWVNVYCHLSSFQKLKA
jgi:hypothetical protein